MFTSGTWGYLTNTLHHSYMSKIKYSILGRNEGYILNLIKNTYAIPIANFVFDVCKTGKALPFQRGTRQVA